MTCKIDHIAIGATTLEQGMAWCREHLGVDLPRGGKHPAMSTHNCVAQAGNASFIELISIDHEAPAPGRVRWFTLDNPTTQNRLAVRPRALCWVVNTTDLDAVIAASPVDLGETVALSRGDLSWKLTVPRDGSLPEQGLLPAFIEWSGDEHPSHKMQDVGLELTSIRLTHPEPDKLNQMLEPLGVRNLVDVCRGADPGLSFVLDTPTMGSVNVW